LSGRVCRGTPSPRLNPDDLAGSRRPKKVTACILGGVAVGTVHLDRIGGGVRWSTTWRGPIASTGTPGQDIVPASDRKLGRPAPDTRHVDGIRQDGGSLDNHQPAGATLVAVSSPGASPAHRPPPMPGDPCPALSDAPPVRPAGPIPIQTTINGTDVYLQPFCEYMNYGPLGSGGPRALRRIQLERIADDRNPFQECGSGADPRPDRDHTGRRVRVFHLVRQGI